MIPTIGQIRAQVEAVLERDAAAPAVGIFASGSQDWPDDVPIGNRRFAIRWCDSPLAVRLALHQRREEHSDGLVIVTPLCDADLGADVLARFARGRVFRVRHWEIVRAAFQARSVEARLGEFGWMADLLIERTPPQGYAPAPSGTLDIETAWRALLQVTLGIETARPDIESLLAWTLQPQSMERWQALSDKAQTGVSDWLEGVSGPAGQLILGVVAAGFGADALPLGLIAEMLFTDESPSPELAAAAVRLERFTSGRRLDPLGAKRWAEAAGRIVRSLESDRARMLLARADQLSANLYLTPYAALSSSMPSGLEARLAEFGEQLGRLVARPECRRARGA